MLTRREPTPRQSVPIRTIAVTIGMVLATAAILLLGWEVRRVLTWVVVAALLSVVLGPGSTWPNTGCVYGASWPPCWSSCCSCSSWPAS
jgi:hypothetical protein